MQKDASTLQSLGAKPATDPSTAIAAGNKALTDAQNAINWANQQGQSINGQAEQISQDASNYASGKNC